MIEIIPAIIPPNLNIVKERLSSVLGAVKKVQIDIVDGQYGNSITWPFNGNQFEEMIKIVREEEKFPYIDDFVVEVDLMVLHPIEYISDFLSLGAKSFVIHIDSTDHIKECINSIKIAGHRVGIGIKPQIDTSLIYPHILEIDFVQFMGNDRIGYNGVSLDQKVIKKIKDFHLQHSSIPIQIDIGVDKNTIIPLMEAGATSFVSGSEVFNSGNPKEAIKNLLKT